MSPLFYYVCIIILSGIQFTNFWETGIPFIALLPVILGLFWAFAYWRNWFWFNSLALIAGISANAFGTWLQFSPFSLVVSTTLLILTWDLFRYRRFLNLAAPDDKIRDLERHHLISLLLYALTVTLMGFGAILYRPQTGFLPAVFLVVVTFVGLMQLVRWFQNANIANE